jgi:hypothetical protein
LVPIAALVKDDRSGCPAGLDSLDETQVKESGVKVVLKTEVTPEMVLKENPDAVVTGYRRYCQEFRISRHHQAYVMILTKLDSLLYMVGPKLAAWAASISPLLCLSVRESSLWAANIMPANWQSF